jgi:hypothetical protein
MAVCVCECVCVRVCVCVCVCAYVVYAYFPPFPFQERIKEEDIGQLKKINRQQ